MRNLFSGGKKFVTIPLIALLLVVFAFASPSSKNTVSTIEEPAHVLPASDEQPICNCSKTCEQISSCSEAQYQLNVCGCSRRDADHDGIACDSAPLKCQN